MSSVFVAFMSLTFQLLHVYQRDSYLTHIDKLQADFDEVLLRLLHEKIHLDIVVVTADLGHITLFEEMTLLKEFEKRETTFTTKYRTKKLGKQAMAIKVGTNICEGVTDDLIN